MHLRSEDVGMYTVKASNGRRNAKAPGSRSRCWKILPARAGSRWKRCRWSRCHVSPIRCTTSKRSKAPTSTWNAGWFRSEILRCASTGWSTASPSAPATDSVRHSISTTWHSTSSASIRKISGGLHLPRLQQTGRSRHVQQRPRRCQIAADPRVATSRRPGEDPVFRRRFPLQAPRRHRRVRLDPPALPHQTQTAGRASRGPKRPFRMQTGARPGHQSQSQVVQERMPSHHRLTIPAHPRFRIRRFGHYRTHRRRFRCLHLPGSERRGRRRNDHQLLVQIVQADRDVQRDGLGMDKLQYLEDKSKYQRAEESEEVCTQVVKLKKTVRFRLFNPNVWPAGNYNNKNFVDFFNFLIT